MVLTRSMAKKKTHNKSVVGVAETSSKQTRKETRNKESTMVLTRSMSKKTTHNKSAVGVAETSSKQTSKKETRNKAKPGKAALDAEYLEYFPKTGYVRNITIMDDAFSLFMKESFLKGYWEKNPGRRLLDWDTNVAGHDKWLSMSDSERAYYVKLVKERRAEVIRKWKSKELH